MRTTKTTGIGDGGEQKVERSGSRFPAIDGQKKAKAAHDILTYDKRHDWTTGITFHEVGTEFEPDFRCGSCADAVRLRRVGESIVDLLHPFSKGRNAGTSTSSRASCFKECHERRGVWSFNSFQGHSIVKSRFDDALRNDP